MRITYSKSGITINQKVFVGYIDIRKLKEFISDLHIKKEVVRKVLGELNETK